MSRFILGVVAVLAVLVLATVPCRAAEPTVVGWRGDWTGRYPQADVPTTWERRSKSPATELSTAAKKPAGATADGATPISEGFIAQWLVAGPFTAADAAAALDQEFLPGESALSPAEGDAPGASKWSLQTRVSFEESARSPKMKDAPWNTAKEDFLDFRKICDAKEPGKVAYAHVYFYSPRAGKVLLLANHSGGMKLWLNGKVAYSSPKDGQGWGYNYWAMNNLITGNGGCPAIALELNAGWNRVLAKVAASKNAWYLDMRVSAPADAGYESKNIVWETRLPLWSRAMPIIVGDKIFVMSEPDELVCLDKRDGKILWRRTNTFFDATPAAERAASPIFKEVEPVMEKMTQAMGYEEIFTLRRQMRDMLAKVDAKKYAWPKPGHYPAHGFTTPTPVSDGQFVYVYLGLGTAACYDLDGNRRWIVRVDDLASEGCFNNQSPVLAGDKFILYRGGYYRALDKRTGQTIWTSDLFSNGVDIYHGDKQSPSINWGGSVVLARTDDGTDVLLGPIKGKVCRVSDGKMLCQAMEACHQSTCLVIGNDIFDGGLVRYRLKKTGPDQVTIADRTQADGPGGFASPLYHDGLVYTLSPHGVLGVFESGEKAVALVYSQQLPMKPLFHFDGPGCTASPVIAGKYVYLMDNKGTTVVIETGKTFKQVAVNRIENLQPCLAPANAQEDTYTTPAVDGSRMYIRADGYLYCIGGK